MTLSIWYLECVRNVFYAYPIARVCEHLAGYIEVRWVIWQEKGSVGPDTENGDFFIVMHKYVRNMRAFFLSTPKYVLNIYDIPGQEIHLL